MRREDLHIGHYVSGAGHLALIGWLLIGDWFTSEPPDFEMSEVSVISGAEFDAMMAAQEPPASSTEVAQPAAPDVTPDAPEVTAEPDAEVAQPVPEPTPAPQEDTAPEVTELDLPPQAEVSDTPPEMNEPIGDQAVLVPEVAPEAAPRPVERVAPEPVARPEPEATPDPVEQEAVTPDAEGEAPEQETQEATAPEEATTEIVTEATKAPAASSRPPGRRPAAPPVEVAEAEPAEEPEPAPEAPEAPADPAPAEADPVSNDDIMAALEAAQDSEAAPAETPAPAPSGPPLSAGEKESLRVAVSNCWNVGSLSSEALRTTVTVAVNLTQDGKPVVSSIRMLGSEGGSSGAAKQAFEAARRAIIRCGARGYPLPAEKYSQWQEIEMTFNPERMRVK